MHYRALLEVLMGSVLMIPLSQPVIALQLLLAQVIPVMIRCCVFQKLHLHKVPV